MIPLITRNIPALLPVHWDGCHTSVLKRNGENGYSGTVTHPKEKINNLMKHNICVDVSLGALFIS
jgi:hypothetical protein